MSKIEQLIKKFCPKGVEWVSLGAIATDFFRGNGILRTQVTEEGTPCVRYGEIYTAYGLSFSKCVSHTNLSYLKSPKYIHTGDIVFAITGEKVEEIGKSTVYVGNEPCLAGGDTAVMRHKQNGRYLAYALATNDAQRQKSRGKKKSKVVHASIPDLKKVKIPLPPLPVQNVIANALDAMDAVVKALEEERNARFEQFEAMRDKLLKFANGGGGYHKITIEGVCRKICSGGTPSTTKKEYYGGTIPWLRTQEIDWRDIMETELTITELGMKNSSAKLIPPNCVIVAMYGATAGKVAINKIALTTNQACCNLEIDDTIADYRFVFHWLSYRYLDLKAKGLGSQSNINAETVRTYGIVLPSLSEQKKIVAKLDAFMSVVSALDEEIAARREQFAGWLEKLMEFKEAA